LILKKSTNNTPINNQTARQPCNPAPGYRIALSGVQNNVYYSGFSYSSSKSDSDVVHLNFNMTGLNPCSTSGRGYGFQLRCLSE
ncbi:hypothetical protein, partial [uncultured Rikenella sp.]|uniref:hypothetical protein n=1 Tax=uncultured Rikenella sp. TaxID=368003 RepID=UPI0026049135